MAAVLIVAEHDGARLNPSTSKCVACATELAPAGIDLAVLGAGSRGVAEAASELAGVSRVLHVDRPCNRNQLAAVLAPQVAELARSYTHVLGPSTTFGKDLMPRVAALLGVGQLSDVMEVVAPYVFRRPIYAGNAIVTVKAREDKPLVATVRTASFAEAAAGGSAPIEEPVVAAEPPGHTRFVERRGGGGERPDLQTATRVVAGGRGLGSGDSFRLVYALADRLGAAVGASRAAVDAGYAPNELQVGQTGKIIAPELYVAIGISGAIQHVTGIKDASTIVAINRDPDAPIFELADLGLVGDLFELVPALLRALEEPRAPG